jgi:hypothetical protein
MTKAKIMLPPAMIAVARNLPVTLSAEKIMNMKIGMSKVNPNVYRKEAMP